MKPKALEPIEELLRRNPGGDFSVQYLTLLTGMNKNQLMKLFKAVYGVTIHQYVLEQRIEMARQLLIDTDEPIKAIAVNTGFGNEKYFIARFRKQTSLTPGAYRRQHKQ